MALTVTRLYVYSVEWCNVGRTAYDMGEKALHAAEVLCRNLLGGTEENRESESESGRDSKRALPEYDPHGHNVITIALEYYYLCKIISNTIESFNDIL
jgi:hypothetical protein